ncbi:MAG: divergent PAP2 family protein [Oscillospiraceae bacterium]|jgi:acid phosphatase family membrane protein YuiD|nr:divergent PAP2 family protein [Oscillospiraceae bacterium]
MSRIDHVSHIIENRVLWTALLAWLTAQIIKVVVVLVTEKRLNIRKIVQSGGMPSSHAAFAFALAVGIGLHDGFGEPIFALACAFALVVSYDASGVRRQAGRHAKVINQLLTDLENLIEKGTPIKQETLIEWIGHTPVEVLCGAVLGGAVAAIIL